MCGDELNCIYIGAPEGSNSARLFWPAASAIIFYHILRVIRLNLLMIHIHIYRWEMGVEKQASYIQEQAVDTMRKNRRYRGGRICFSPHNQEDKIYMIYICWTVRASEVIYKIRCR